jgi:hypothetical protein
MRKNMDKIREKRSRKTKCDKKPNKKNNKTLSQESEKGPEKLYKKAIKFCHMNC